VKKLFAVVFAVALLASLSGVGFAAATGNGAPNGAHYNLNIIGVQNPKTADMTGDNGHRIFVPLNGNAKIMLTKAAEADQFEVIDANGTDGVASFMLPLPAECYATSNVTLPNGHDDIVTPATCTVSYTIWIRALGNPNGKATMYTCLVDESQDVDNDGASDTYCSDLLYRINLDASTRPSKFENVTKQLLFVSTDIDGDGVVEHVQIFDPMFDEYFWQYNNAGLKLAQLRFYMGDETIVWP